MFFRLYENILEKVPTGQSVKISRKIGTFERVLAHLHVNESSKAVKINPDSDHAEVLYGPRFGKVTRAEIVLTKGSFIVRDRANLDQFLFLWIIRVHGLSQAAKVASSAIALCDQDFLS